MWLAIVRRLYPDELVCDFAETYGITDCSQHPTRLVATLLKGLRADSRVIARVIASQKEKETESEYKAYDTPEEYERARLERIKRKEGS